MQELPPLLSCPRTRLSAPVARSRKPCVAPPTSLVRLGEPHPLEDLTLATLLLCGSQLAPRVCVVRFRKDSSYSDSTFTPAFKSADGARGSENKRYSNGEQKGLLFFFTKT